MSGRQTARIHVRTARASTMLLAVHLLTGSPLPAQTPSAAAQSAIAGAVVFREQGCVACHTVSGSGGSLGPDLRTATASIDVYGITADLWNHLPEMTGRMDSLSIRRPRLSTRETGDLVAFLYMIGSGPRSGSAEAGERFFRESGCIRCHRIGSAGGVIGPALDRIPSLRSPHGLAAGLWNHSGAMIPRMVEMGIPYPTVTAIDLANLEAFIVGTAERDEAVDEAPSWVLPGSADRGRELVEQSGCRSCHLIAGRGAGSAPELAAAGSRRSSGEYLAALWNKGPAMRAAFAARGESPPVFEPGEMADLTAYLQSLGYFRTSGSAARGRAIARDGGCLICHGWGGAGDSAGDLARVTPHPDVADRVAVLWNHMSVLDASDPVRNSWPQLDRSETIDLLEFLGAGSR